MLENRNVHIKTRQHDVDGRENGALCADERVDVDLGDRNFAAGLALIGSRQNVAPHAVLVVGDSAAVADKLALRGDDRGTVELGNHIDDTRAADADGLLARIADDRERGLHGIFVNGHGLDRSVRCAHAAGNVAALKRGTRRARAGHHKVAIAEDKLAVRAKVNEEREFVLVPN